MAIHRIAGFFFAVAGVVFVVALAGSRSQGAKDEFRFDAATLRDTTLWTQVNAQPYRMSVASNIACAVTPAPDIERKRNPHAASVITVYVNKVGQEAMFAKKIKRFPEGSIIVKQKNRFEGGKPILYTLMRKREAGYNPTVGDWEFSVVGPNGTEIQATGKIESCQGCHKGKQDSDHVFRPYLKTRSL